MDITETVRQIPENRECGGAAAGLRALRDSLRGDRSKGERLRPVCSDAVLAEISARLPVRIEDLEAIPGIGRRFIALYGDIFLSVTRKYSSANAGGTEMRCETAGTLREMEKNLTDLGRGNRMLYQPRLFRLSGLDLTDLDADIAGFLAGVSEISVSPRDPHYKRISELIRESGRELRDRGRSDLYAAFPFAEGILPDGFPVKAPLVLYPAAAVREKGEIRITLDGSREAVYNAALILAAMKASGKDGAVPDCCAGSSAVPFDVAAGFYRENGIVLRNLPEGYEKFRSGDPECSGNSLKTSAYAVLGRYPIYSCAVQRDFETILSGNSVSGILDRFTSRRGSCAVPEPESGVPVTAGKLDSSQERAVSALENSEGLVICGPPGTGKSQVITEAAVSAVLGGKNVLIVSEKKAALDVVRSRLGTLSRYCMMIDDAGNKESFYRQLSSALEPEPEKPCPDLRKCIAGSAKAAAKLESLEKGLYGERESGMVPADLYSGDLARGSSPYDAAADNSLSSGVTGLDYGSVLSLHGYFSEAGRAERYIRYRKLMEKHRIFLGMRSDLTKIELSEFRRKLQDLTDPSYSRVRISKEASLITAEYFTSCNSSISGIISGDPMQVIAALDRYQLYSEGSGEFGDLPAEWKSYGNGIAELSEEQGISPEESEKLMFARMQHFKIREFDGAYDSSGLEAFGEYSRMMSRRSEEQRTAARGAAESVLRERADRMKRSARFGEMERIITSSRRWSPPRFAGRFAYELSEGIRIWLMTPETVSEILPLEMGMFDLLIIDEASQMYAERAVPSLFRSKKAAVAGDPKQLRPSSLGVCRYGSDERSVLDLACGKFGSVMLTHHYRSRSSSLISFSDRAFYGGKLDIVPDTVISGKPAIRVIRTDGIWENRQNIREAEETVKVLKEVLTTRGNGETVGIITFNSSQRDAVADALERECAADRGFGKLVRRETERIENGEYAGLFVKNVETVQGDERDIIIFSAGYAPDRNGNFVQRFGWLNAGGGENRLNVAITRSRTGMIILRSFEPEMLRTDGKLSGPYYFKRFLQYADAVSSGDAEAAREILSSFGGPEKPDSPQAAFLGELESALVREGFAVERNVGSGIYGMDLAVGYGNRRILGIQTDARMYSSGESLRSRDCLSREFLESKGWKIIRLWTPLFWRDRGKEIRKITEAARKIYSL